MLDQQRISRTVSRLFLFIGENSTKMNKSYILGSVLLLLSTSLPGIAQEFTHTTFKDRRVINTQSVETLAKRRLDVRISHRFGDLAGDNGGFQTLFGLENASDILIGVEYGLSDNVNIGLFRAKGAGSMPNGVAGLRQLLNGTLKWRLLRQREDGGAPVTVTFAGTTTLSTAKRAENNESALNSFPRPFFHRMAYHAQVLVARKFSDGFSLQFSPGYTYRNLVPSGDVNGIATLGVASRIQLSRVFGLIADATIPFQERRLGNNGFYIPLGLGLEIDTGGHIFQVNLTNATALMETDYIPYTTSNWLDGQFRLGFTISRLFNL